jgi:hypothetical protein
MSVGNTAEQSAEQRSQPMAAVVQLLLAHANKSFEGQHHERRRTRAKAGANCHMHVEVNENTSRRYPEV